MSITFYLCIPTGRVLKQPDRLGSFDSSVHISEEAGNAATAVPWAIVSVTCVSRGTD